jgi:hypothetical protein
MYSQIYLKIIWIMNMMSVFLFEHVLSLKRYKTFEKLMSQLPIYEEHSD